MAYVTGTASDMTDLRGAVQSACVAAGWTLRGEVLSKGNGYVRLQVVSGYLTVLGGTGVDAGNLITGSAGMLARIGAAWSSAPVDVVAFPLSYELFIHAAPDEVFLVVNYNVARYQWLAFGSSPTAGLPGTGNWFGASCGSTTGSSKIIIVVGTTGYSGYLTPALFFSAQTNGGSTGYNAFVHHDLDGLGWSSNASRMADGIAGQAVLLAAQPNAWNSEMVLLPIQPCVFRTAGIVSMVADLQHARYARIDNIDPGAIISLGPDRWKVYPWFEKNIAARDGGTAVTHTGTLGWAIRYDGP